MLLQLEYEGFSTMASVKNKERFEKSVKPFFYPAEQCYIAYSESKKLSSKAKFGGLTTDQVKAKFGFELLCDDLLKSVKATEAYRFKNDIKIAFPDFLNVQSYGIEANTLNLFVLHKTSTKMGYGISTYSALEKGSIVAEYIGERKIMGTRLDDSSYVLLSNDGTKIDAKDYGNVARFFNHCPSNHTNEQVLTANLMALPWPASATLTKSFFITVRDIKAFEPLCWDYGDKYSFDQGVELLNAETYLPLTEFNHEL